MTSGKAALIDLLRRYCTIALDASQIEVQKLMYFLQVAGEDLRLDYNKGRYGPYADNLRKVLRAMEGHYTVGFGDGTKPALEAEPLDLRPGAAEQADRVLDNVAQTRARIDRMLELVAGFESMYGLELLSSVHWAATHDGRAAADPEVAAEQVAAWTGRKRRLMGPEHVTGAWNHLRSQGWLPAEVLCAR